MPGLNIILDGDNAWPDLKGRQLPEATLESVVRLTGGMQSGRSSVAFRFQLPDGTTVFAQTSMALFQSAAQMFRVRDEMEADAFAKQLGNPS